MGIKLNGSTSGYVQIDAPAVAGSTQITLPATTGGSFVVSDASGNVGIGTTDYGQFNRGLSIYASGGVYSGIQLTNSTTGNAGTAGTQLYTNGNDFNIHNKQTGNIILVSAGTERARIDTSGVVQVGGTTVGNTVGYVNSRTNARAWVNFNGTSATPITPRANYNISSVTKNATGDYTLNFTTALADANYAWSYGGTNNINDTATNNVIAVITTTAYQTAASLRIVTKYVGGGGNVANADFSIVCINIFGN